MGTNSCTSSNCFVVDKPPINVVPVTLPPGRLKLATKPTWTGSTPMTKTTGMVEVAALAASPP